MHQVAVEQQHRAGLAAGRDQAALVRQTAHRGAVERPERIGGRLQVVPGLQHAGLVAARNEEERAVHRRHLVDEDGDVHGPRLGHLVVARPGAVVLVPLPDLAVEGGLGVDLVLMHVEAAAQQLLDRRDQARIGAQAAEGLVVRMRGEGRTRDAGLLAPDLLAIQLEDLLGLVLQQLHLFRVEGLGEEKPALAVELGDLGIGQAHGAHSLY
jgi:hypothetical protein